MKISAEEIKKIALQYILDNFQPVAYMGNESIVFV